MGVFDSFGELFGTFESSAGWGDVSLACLKGCRSYTNRHLNACITEDIKGGASHEACTKHKNFPTEILVV